MMESVNLLDITFTNLSNEIPRLLRHVTGKVQINLCTSDKRVEQIIIHTCTISSFPDQR